MYCAEPFVFKCGLRLPNRLVKAAMSEDIATPDMLPSEKIRNVYDHWAEGGWGMIITGNVQIDERYLGTSTDLGVNSSLSDAEILKTWAPWAAVCGKNGTAAIMQLNHPGRQCPIGAGKRGPFSKNIAPSPVGLKMGAGVISAAVSAIAFGTPRELGVPEISSIVQRFTRAAVLASQSGFAGVEIHASHGYLLDQFLSADTNRRGDAYGGSPSNRAKIVVEVIQAIRRETPQGFCVGVLCSAPVQRSGSEFDSVMEQLSILTNLDVDYIHISGGTFEIPTMFLGPDHQAPPSTMSPFFTKNASLVRQQIRDVPIIITGGFRSRNDIETILRDGACDMVGITRPAAVHPDLPTSVILNTNIGDSMATLHLPRVEAPWVVRQMGITALNVHMDNAWYLGHLKKMACKKALTGKKDRSRLGFFRI